MSNHDQCPSSKKEGKPVLKPRVSHDRVGIGRGESYWRGLDDLADTHDFREALEREFPAGASELLDPGTRRTFLKLMGASFALAGVAALPGCRRPDHKILPYSKTVPEDVVPGKPLFYATAIASPFGGCEGLLAETHEGRPTKLEGNPLHPTNQGKSTVWSQAVILDLYDPDRQDGLSFVEKPAGHSGATPAKHSDGGADAHSHAHTDNDPRHTGTPASWVDFANWWKFEDKAAGKPNFLAKFAASKGKGLAIVMDRHAGGPTRDRLVARLQKDLWPEATWVSFDALENRAEVDALAAACGKPGARAVHSLDAARVIVSLDADLLGIGAGQLANARGWGAARRVWTTKAEPARLYVLESGFSTTGAAADHRAAMAPSRIVAAAVALARAVLVRLRAGALPPSAAALESALTAVPAGEALTPEQTKLIDAIADDLVSGQMRVDKDLKDVSRQPGAGLGSGLIAAGPTMPAEVHALVAALNAVLGNVGKTVRYVEDPALAGESSAAALKRLCDQLDAGAIECCVVLGANPAFNAPADLAFADKFPKAAHRIVLCYEPNETAVLANWRLPLSHGLEQWNDTRALTGEWAVTQPMIAPLYKGRADFEVLAMLASGDQPVPVELVRETWRDAVAKMGGGDFEAVWRRSLHDGVARFAGSSGKAADLPVDVAKASALAGKIQPTKAASGQGAVEFVFTTTHNWDGRYANNGWLQELPDPASRVVWDNPAYMSVKTARDLGLSQTPDTDEKPKGRIAELSVNGKPVTVACWAVPGIADGVVLLPLGFGRRSVGLVGQRVGFDLFAARTSAAPWTAPGTIKAADSGAKWYKISCTQTHGSMEGRALVREVDIAAWAKWGDDDSDAKAEDTYGRPHNLSFAERLEGSDFNHMPAAVGVYNNPYNASPREVDPAAKGYQSNNAPRGVANPPAYAERPQWGMSIDLAQCIGCNVCTIACQAENNIPIVGKVEVNKGREMQWIRVDRYFTGDRYTPSGMVYQPVACVHCENAPCETVCPVNATVHGPEGHNYMVYNRCIGTRYCANNCPYKVRRFNWFDYGVAKFNGGLRQGLEESVPSFVNDNLPENQNLIPPRLRKKLDEIAKMQKNPNVTVRSRGVMEKCSYCIQRTNEAKIDFRLGEKKKGRDVRPEDGLPDGFVQTACQQACPTGAIVFGDILDTKSSNAGKGSLIHQLRNHERSYLLLGYLGTRPRTTYLCGVRNPNPALAEADRKKHWEMPFMEERYHEAGPGHAPGHGSGAHGGKAADAGRPFIDPDRAGTNGYVISLAVLGGAR